MSTDVALAAKSNATIVILMGMGKLAEIVELFKLEGKADMPIAIIQNGTREDEKLGIGTIDTIEQIVVERQLSNPAILVVGGIELCPNIRSTPTGVINNKEKYLSKIV